MTERHPARLVVVTHAETEESPLIRHLEQAGLRVWSIPVVAHDASPDLSAIDLALAHLEVFDWVVFTSSRAVDAVWGRPAWRRWPWRDSHRPRVAAVGPSTAARLVDRGIPVAVRPINACAANLARAMVEAEHGTLAGRAVLWPRSEIARLVFKDALVAAGARVVDPVVYRTVPARPADLDAFLARLHAGGIDAVTFLSPSSADNLAACLEGRTLSPLAGRTIVASIGPATSLTLARLGAPPNVQAAEHTATGMVSALIGCFSREEGLVS